MRKILFCAKLAIMAGDDGGMVSHDTGCSFRILPKTAFFFVLGVLFRPFFSPFSPPPLQRYYNVRNFLDLKFQKCCFL